MNTPWEAAQDAFSVFILDSKEKIVADVRSNGLPMHEHAAIARMIALAPEMLAFLQKWRPFNIEADEVDQDHYEDELEDLISRAEIL